MQDMQRIKTMKRFATNVAPTKTNNGWTITIELHFTFLATKIRAATCAHVGKLQTGQEHCGLMFASTKKESITSLVRAMMFGFKTTRGAIGMAFAMESIPSYYIVGN